MPTILKPNSPSRRWKALRRKRLPKDAGSLNGVPIIREAGAKKSRSRYQPHVGKKQLARL